MKITELYLKNYGKFSEKHFYLKDGIQVIYGENEFGKSTLHAFIRAMLFGMERGRGRAAGRDAFSRYEPWENPNYYAGVMRFVCGGRNFRLERSFDRFSRHVSLICEDDGEELSVEHGDLDMLLGDMTPSEFDNTVSVGQLLARPGQELAEALKNYAANYYETGGGEVDLNGALLALKERRREVEGQLKTAESQRVDVYKGLSQECGYLEKDLQKLKEEYEEARREYENGQRLIESTDKKERTEEKEQKERERQPENGGYGESARGLLMGGMAGVFAGVCGIAWACLLRKWSAFSGAVPVAVFGFLILAAGILLISAGVRRWVREKKRRNEYVSKKTIYSHDKFRLQDEAVRLEERQKQLRWEMSRIQAEWKEKHIRYENLNEQIGENIPGEEENRLKERKKALLLAEEKIKTAAGKLGRQTSDYLNQRASEIFSELTEGKYRRLQVNERFEISVWDGTRYIRTEQLSRGTLEQIYFSIRMSAAELLQEEPMPVILDDTFAFYDEKRLESVLKWLSRQERQVIIFTCHKREEEILRIF